MNCEIFRAYNVCVHGVDGRELRNLSFSLCAGEIFGIHGNRYAGKTALIQLLTGAIQPDSGTAEFYIPHNEERTEITSISKEAAVIPEMTVWENFQILCSPQRLLRWVNASNIRSILRLVAKRYGIRLDPDAQASTLGSVQCIMLEILAAKYRGAKLILMDISGIEGTPAEFSTLKALLDQIKQEGITFLIFGHQNARLYSLSDRIGILHKGRIIQIFSTSEISMEALTSVISGLYTNPRLYPRVNVDEETVLKIENMNVGLGSPVSFYVNAGELIALFCPTADMFLLLQEKLATERPKKSSSGGIFFVDTPQLEWVIREMSPLENICLGLTDRGGRPLLHSPSIRSTIQQDFSEWYGDDLLMDEKDCTCLHQRERIALNLFRLRLINPKVIICNDISTYNDIVTYHMALDALADMAENRTAVCITTNTMSMGESIHRYVVLQDE